MKGNFVNYDKGKDTDEWALANHFVSVVPVQFDLTAYPAISSLNKMLEVMPERVFDVGIAEEHAVTFAAGLARAGVRPILSIYSTFLQRGFDQVIHDVCLQERNIDHFLENNLEAAGPDQGQLCRPGEIFM